MLKASPAACATTDPNQVLNVRHVSSCQEKAEKMRRKNAERMQQKRQEQKEQKAAEQACADGSTAR